jgi:GT2 family glycosyltransferase
MMLVAPRKLSSLTGAALLMKRRVFDCLNGFDPLLATYLQDVDLSLRAINSGFPLIFEPRAILIHMESVSIKPELTGDYMNSVRHNEYAYFAQRWATTIVAGDEWVNRSFDPSDESMRTLRA